MCIIHLIYNIIDFKNTEKNYSQVELNLLHLTVVLMPQISQTDRQTSKQEAPTQM